MDIKKYLDKKYYEKLSWCEDRNEYIKILSEIYYEGFISGVSKKIGRYGNGSKKATQSKSI